MRANGLLATTGAVVRVDDLLHDRHHAGPLPDRRRSPGRPQRVGEAIATLQEYGISQLPGLRAARRRRARGLVGSITEKGLLDRAFRDPSIVERTVGEVMDPPLPFVDVEASLDQAFALLSAGPRRSSRPAAIARSASSPSSTSSNTSPTGPTHLADSTSPTRRRRPSRRSRPSGSSSSRCRCRFMRALAGPRPRRGRGRDRRHRPGRPARHARPLPPVPDRRPVGRPGGAAVARPGDRPDRAGRHAPDHRLVRVPRPTRTPTAGSRSAIASSRGTAARASPPRSSARCSTGRPRARRRSLPGVGLAGQRRVAGDHRAASASTQAGVQIDDIDGEELVFELDGWPPARPDARG